MAEAADMQITYLVIDSSKAVGGANEAKNALDAVERASLKTQSSLQRIEAGLTKIGGYLKANLAIMLTELALHLVAVGMAAFQAASGLDELSDQLGITTRGLQGLQYIAVQNGASLETLEGAVGKFGQKMGEAADGSKTVIDALKALGVQNLDAAGKLRPTEELMAEVAGKLNDIEDPARKAAMAVEFFGKKGKDLIPSFKEMSEGMDTLALRAEHAGAMISAHTIKRLDEMADAMERHKLTTRAFLAEGLVKLVDWYQNNKDTLQTLPLIGPIIALIENLDKLGPAFDRATTWAGDMIATIRQGWQDGLVAIAAGYGRFLDMLDGVGASIKRIFIDAMNVSIEAIEKGVNAASTIKYKTPYFNTEKEHKLFDPLVLPRISGDPSAGPMMTNEQRYRAAQQRAGGQRDFKQELADQRQQTLAEWFAQQEAAAAGYTKPTTGVKTSTPTPSGGKTPGEKYDDLMTKLKLTAEAQDLMTAAALRGDQAFEQQKVHVEAQEKAFEIFGVELKNTDQRLIDLEKSLMRIAQGKMQQAFAVGTTELQKQNEYLEAQIRLSNELPEIAAKELAAIKAKQEAQKAGLALDSEQYKTREAALEQNLKLTQKAEELKKAQEIWTEPLKQALRDIQKIGADAWEQLLTNGKLTFEALGDVFKVTIRRMVAEFLTLATVRPVMSVLVNSISPSIANQMGFPTSSGGMGSIFGGNTGMGGSGISNFTLPEWAGGGQPFSFLGNSIPGTAGFNTPSISAEIANWSTYGTAAQNSMGNLASVNGGISWGAGLGAAAGGAMGLYQLMSAKSTSGKIGGIASMIGAGISLIPGIGQIAGPLIGILGNILPGLLGVDGAPPKITNQEYGQIAYGTNGFTTSGGAWGPDANSNNLTGALGGVGQNMQGIYTALGGVKDPSKVWGVAMESFSQSQGDWSFNNKTSFVVDPNGNKRQWGQGSNDSDIGMIAAGVSATLSSILDGAVGDISENLRKGLSTVNLDGHGTFEQLGLVVQTITQFDKAMSTLGKTTVAAEDGLNKIRDSFAEMWNFAKANDFASDATKIEKFKEEQYVEYAKGFMAQFDISTDPMQKALDDLDKQKADALKNAEYLQGALNTRLDLVEAYYIDQNKITDYYLKQETAIKEQYYTQSLSSLTNTLQQLTLGPLANLSPTAQLTATADRYTMLLGKANKGDQDARNAIGQAGVDYVTAANSYYGGNLTAEEIRRQIVMDIAKLAVDVGGDKAADDIADLTGAMAIIGQQLSDLRVEMQQSGVTSAAREAKYDELLALFERIAVNVEI